MTLPIRIEIPLDPVAQSRPRASLMVKDEALRSAMLPGWRRRELASVLAAVKRVCRGSIHITEQRDSAAAKWKQNGQLLLRAALGRHRYRKPDPTTPLEVWIWAWWTWPKSEQRVRTPKPLELRTRKPDGDNVEKCILDTCSGLLWADDNQVAVCHWTKLMASQGDRARVVIQVAEAGFANLYEPGPRETLEGLQIVSAGR